MKNQTQYSVNCDLLGTGDKASDHAHVTKVTPLQTKAKELADDKKYRTELSAGFNTERQSSTTRKRRQTPGHEANLKGNQNANTRTEAANQYRWSAPLESRLAHPSARRQ